MVRFIFVCMAVVALSLVAIVAQYMTDGIGAATQTVIARNSDSASEGAQTLAASADASAEELNAIETTAGTPSFDSNDTFNGGFTGEAPKALADTPAPVTVSTPSVGTQAN